MINKSKFFFLIFFFIFLIFFLIYIEINSHNNINNLTTINKVQDLKVQDLKVNNIIEKLNSNSYSNFDKLTELLKQIPDDFSEIEFLKVLTHDEIIKFKKLFSDKKEQILLIKIKSATIKNSLNFIPTISKEIISSNQIEKELLELLNQIFRDILYFSQTKDENLRENFQKSVRQLVSYNKKYNNKKLMLLTLHIEHISKELFVFNEISKKILSLPLDTHLDNIITRLDSEHIQKLKENKIYEYIMLAMIIMLSLLFYIYYQKDEKAKNKLLQQAKIDILTGALNRFAFNNFKILQAKENNHFVVFDIDNFKHLNEVHGPTNSDNILKFLYKKIINNFCNDIYRIDSDKFIVYTSLSIDTIRSYIKTIKNEIKAAPTHFDFTTLIYPIENNLNSDVLKDIAAGIYSIRKKDNKEENIFRSEDKYVIEYKGLSEEVVKKKNELISIINENKIVPFFQPILDVASGKIYKYEVLSRIKTDNGDLLPPFEYILLAEKFGLINSFTLELIKQTFERIQDKQNIEFSINLSIHDLESKETLSSILELVESYKIDSNIITFEITETSVMSDIRHSIEIINKLKNQGFKIAIDDFGVGHSSLQYLKDIPADFIKLDGVFIKNLHTSSSDREFVEIIDKIIKMYGKKTVAEFVENNEILEILKYLQIDFAQGYFIGKAQSDFIL